MHEVFCNAREARCVFFVILCELRDLVVKIKNKK